VQARHSRFLITSRATAALRLECIRIYEEGIASIEDIDKAMRLGPTTQWVVSSSTTQRARRRLTTRTPCASLRRIGFAAPQSLLGRVRAGMLGAKPVRAGYDYSGEKPKAID